MASLALPKFAVPRLDLGATARNPFVGAAGAGLLFLGAAGAVMQLMAPAPQPSQSVSLGKGPAGWRDGLRAGHGSLEAQPMRLTERPLKPLSGGRAQPPPGLAADGALPAAPLAGLTAPGPTGYLPIIATDGRTPARAYARPFAPNGRPKIALVVGGLGLDAGATEAAIDTLPPEVTLAFVVYSENLQGWIDRARARGHEVLLEAPMEPMDYPDNDPGPYALMSEAPAAETVKKLEWVLSRATGYFGLTHAQGSRFLANPKAYAAFASAARGRGLAFIDDGSAAGLAGGLPRASVNRTLDTRLARAPIDAELLSLESAALERGQALGAGAAYPVTLTAIRDWAKAAEVRGFQLAPASALAAVR